MRWALVLLLAATVRAEELAELAPQLRAAQANALAILFDDARYPVPAKASKGWRVGIDKQPGHEAMERAVADAIVLHNKAAALVAAKYEIATKVVGLKKPTLVHPKAIRPVMRYGILVLDARAFFKKRSKGEFAAFARGDWAQVKQEIARRQGADALVWRMLRDAAVLDWNERKKAAHTSNERDGMRIVNAYRVSLGLPPLILDKRLHHAAADFGTEMKRLKFFAHHHPYDRTRRTLQRRVKRMGYRGKVGENVSSSKDGPTVVWNWRGDAGHHRLLVMSVWRAGGLGCVKPSVLNVGSTSTAKILAMY